MGGLIDCGTLVQKASRGFVKGYFARDCFGTGLEGKGLAKLCRVSRKGERAKGMNFAVIGVSSRVRRTAWLASCRRTRRKFYCPHGVYVKT
jgi:hypothetical protein